MRILGAGRIDSGPDIAVKAKLSFDHARRCFWPRISPIDSHRLYNRSVFGRVKRSDLYTSTPGKQEHPMSEARKNTLRVDLDRSDQWGLADETGVSGANLGDLRILVPPF